MSEEQKEPSEIAKEIAQTHRSWRQARPTYNFEEDKDLAGRIEAAISRHTERIAELEREKHLSDQAAGDNADWFSALVSDLGEKLGCENEPTVIFKEIERMVADANLATQLRQQVATLTAQLLNARAVAEIVVSRTAKTDCPVALNVQTAMIEYDAGMQAINSGGAK